MTCMFAICTIGYAEFLNNGVKVENNSDLTYYLNIDYDGVDETAQSSSDTVTINVKSDIIEVTDKLPQGFTYKGIVETDTGQIGAFKRSDGTTCYGYVVDGIDGIRYDSQNHTISFKVRDLGAGCRLTVGIIVTTPISVTGRMDFYNSFSAFENFLFKISNRVHVFMGGDEVTTYKVKYEYIGDVPENAPVLEDYDYAGGTNISVLEAVNILGYEFSGWDTDDVNVSNETFIMPDRDVTFKGSFIPKTKYQVKYEIDGDIPKGYIVPKTESFYEFANVEVNSLKQGDIVNGYIFEGWKTTDVEILENIFHMPNKNVLIKGKFRRVSYTVSYAFEGIDIPEAGDSLLPDSETYYPGDIVTINNIQDVNGYKFLGWYSADKFKMPEHDVIIYGEWIKCNGLFEPIITKKILNKSEEYYLNDKVLFEIEITNAADYDIKNVVIHENNDLATFINGDDYVVNESHTATIPLIKGNESVIVRAEYIVTKESPKIEKNEVEILGALADDDYLFNNSKEYKASVEFRINNEENIDVPKTSNESRDIITTFLLFVIAGLYISIFGYHKLKKKN